MSDKSSCVIEQKIENGICKVKLSGAISERDSLEINPGSVAEVHINCRDVLRINSMGLRNWLSGIATLRAKLKGADSKLRFFELSVAIVNQCNRVSGLVRGSEIVSLYLPYYCSHCNAELEELALASELKKGKWTVPTIICPKCANSMTFDAKPGDYFMFLTTGQ